MPRDGNIEAQRKRDLIEARVLIRSVADPRRPSDTVKARIARAAIRLGWSYQRTENVWRGDARRIDAFEMDQLRNWQAPD